MEHCIGCRKKFKGKEFHIVCSPKCPALFVSKKCSTCGIEFFRPRSVSNKIKFCSQYCREVNELVSKKDKLLTFAISRKYEFSRWRGKRRHSKMVSGDKIDSFSVFELFNWKCILCDQEIEMDLPDNHPRAASLEHIIPVSHRSGTHTWFNVAPAHIECNLNKDSNIDTSLIDKTINIWLNI